MAKRILIVGADPALCTEVARLAAALACDAVACTTAAAAIARLSAAHFDLCVVDLGLRADEATAIVLKARTSRPSVATVALAAAGGCAQAVEALRAGAVEIVAKPFCPVTLVAIMRRLIARRGGLRHQFVSTEIVGDHPRVRRMLDRVDQIADTDAAVLIRGETGTGKEVVARLVHGASARRAGPFVAVNLAAIPEAIAEVELFGEPDSSAGEARRMGRVVAANGGTLFLDEIGEMPRSAQARLLDVLERRAVAREDRAPVATDVRVVASTQLDLEAMVERGAFRADLYYHLAVAPIEIPPLRERREDIPALADHFRRAVNAREGRAVPGFALDVMRRLTCYDWPGNVRELEHVVERLVVLAGTRMVVMPDLPSHLRIQVVDLQDATRALGAGRVDLRVFLSELEDRVIVEALARAGGDRQRAAELLGIEKGALVEKLRRRHVA